MRVLSYQVWKQIVQAKPLWKLYHLEVSVEAVDIWAGLGSTIFKCSVNGDDWTDWSTNFASNSTLVEFQDDAPALLKYLSVDAEGNDIYTSHLEPVQSGSTPTLVTPNWCDKTTWYQKSTRVEDETLTLKEGTTDTFQGIEQYWVDLCHGKLTQEHRIADPYKVVVKVDGSLKEENSPGESDKDYTVDYAAGEVIFNEDPTGTVTASYNYAEDSTWTLTPEPGKKVLLRAVEVQMSTDVSPQATTVFAPYGPVEIFAPHLMQAPHNIPSGTKIQLKDNRYPRMHNFIDEAQGSHPIIPATGDGDTNWRGMKKDMIIFRWPYTAAHGQYVSIDSALGMELRIYLDGHKEFLGERAVASLYARTVDS